MLDRLQIVKQRFFEISDLIIQPDVISDQNVMCTNQEYKSLKVCWRKRDEYVIIMANIEEANEIIADNSGCRHDRNGQNATRGS
jgi:peptide chain release factor 1